MSLRFASARALSAVSTWGLKTVFRRPAANFPGKIALYADPQLISHLRSRLARGSVCVVGTNGKTTVTNLLADTLERAGNQVVCNRTGANLDSGVATSLLHTQHADWGVFETDELWLAKILPQLQSDYVVLLNLFRDQLDRVGEIDHIQQSIVGALEKSPATTLVYNADDPLCQAIANQVSNPTLAFGVAQDMHLEQNTVTDASMCQNCSTILEYAYRQYGQLGDYTCPTCGFTRSALSFGATEVNLGATGLSFAVAKFDAAGKVAQAQTLNTPFTGSYMVYNLTAVFTAATLLGVDAQTIQAAITAFDPKNGRLQDYTINGRHVLLNLAKNPTGFNQNLRLVARAAAQGSCAVAFFINDKEADGHDVSWLWDIDFQELAYIPGIVAYAGGLRKNDMQVRLKYAGLSAALVDDAQDVLAQSAQVLPGCDVFIIANYTALPGVKAQLDALEARESGAQPATLAPAPEAQPETSVPIVQPTDPTPIAQPTAPAPAAKLKPLFPSRLRPFVIAHLFPELLNLYGDGGNVIVLQKRLLWRDIPVRVDCVHHGDSYDLTQADIVFIGGGPDREQLMASEDLRAMKQGLQDYVNDNGVLLAICGGYQIIGQEWLLGDDVVPGLGLVDLTTRRAEGGSYNRLVGNVALKSMLADHPVIGYENHAGRTYLGADLKPFGQVMGNNGKGNNGTDNADGALYKNVVGTYLHGPLLAKNPEVADELINRALIRRAHKDNAPVFNLAPLDDAQELAANQALCNMLGVRG